MASPFPHLTLVGVGRGSSTLLVTRAGKISKMCIYVIVLIVVSLRSCAISGGVGSVPIVFSAAPAAVYIITTATLNPPARTLIGYTSGCIALYNQQAHELEPWPVLVRPNIHSIGIANHITKHLLVFNNYCEENGGTGLPYRSGGMISQWRRLETAVYR